MLLPASLDAGWRSAYSAGMRKTPALLLQLVLPLLLLVGCAEPPPPPLVSAAARQIDATRLEIRTSTPAPLEAAELTAPDGRVFAARRITAPGQNQEAPMVGRPSVVLGGSGGSSSGLDAGIGLSLPIRNPFSSGERARPFASQAEFSLPAEALARYRDQQAAGWTLYLLYGNSSRSLAAPPVEQ